MQEGLTFAGIVESDSVLFDRRIASLIDSGGEVPARAISRALG